MFAGQKGSLWNAAGHGDIQEPVPPINGVLPSSRCVWESFWNKPWLHQLRPLGRGEQTHSLQQQGGRKLSISIAMATRQSLLKAFQESLLFVETGLHSPKTSIPPPHTLSVAASLYFPSLQLKRQEWALVLHSCWRPFMTLTWNAPIRNHTSQRRSQRFSFPYIHRPSCEMPLADSWIPNGIGEKKKKILIDVINVPIRDRGLSSFTFLHCHPNTISGVGEWQDNVIAIVYLTQRMPS